MTNPGPRSPINRQIAELHDLKALVLDINDVRKELRLEAWERGDKALWQRTERIRKALLKMKRILQAQHMRLLGEKDGTDRD